MTTSLSTRSPGRLNPTRQQLDELDALLQRMLDLPVNPLDEPEQAEVEEPLDEPPPIAANLVERPALAVRRELDQPADDVLPPEQPETRPARPPISYMVVETASPRPLPPASGFEPRRPVLALRLTPVTPQPETPEPTPVTSKEWEVKKMEEEEKSEEQTSPHFSLPTPQVAPAADEPSVPVTDEAEMWVPLRSTWQPSAQTWPPLAESWHLANGGTAPLTAPSPILTPRIDPTPTAPTKIEEATNNEPEATNNEQEAKSEEQPAPPASREQPRLSLSAEDAPARVPGLLLPLLWFNQGFDACLTPLGASGRWLCGSGRSVLGFLGLACLAAAIAIALSAGMAWTW
jgi:hypothetical protein